MPMLKHDFDVLNKRIPVHSPTLDAFDMLMTLAYKHGRIIMEKCNTAVRVEIDNIPRSSSFIQDLHRILSRISAFKFVYQFTFTDTCIVTIPLTYFLRYAVFSSLYPALVVDASF